MSAVDIKCLREHRALILPLRPCVVVRYLNISDKVSDKQRCPI
jgi:hypothetical protein